MEPLYLLWEECQREPITRVALRNGYQSMQALLSEFQQAGLTGRGKGDPSPDEIQAETASLRRNWSKQVEQSRWIGRGR